MPFYCCLPSDKYIRPCNWGMEGGGAGGVVRESGEGKKKKSGGVEGYGCFSLGDRACCHGAGPPIGGRPVQSLNSTDCFIIEKFFLSSCLAGHPFLLHLSSPFLIVSRLHGPSPGSYSGAHHDSCIPCIRVRLSLSRGFRLSLCMQYIITPPKCLMYLPFNTRRH